MIAGDSYPYYFRVAWRSCYISSVPVFLRKECGYFERFIPSKSLHKWKLIVMVIIMTIIIMTIFI